MKKYNGKYLLTITKNDVGKSFGTIIKKKSPRHMFGHGFGQVQKADVGKMVLEYDDGWGSRKERGMNRMNRFIGSIRGEQGAVKIEKENGYNR